MCVRSLTPGQLSPAPVLTTESIHYATSQGAAGSCGGGVAEAVSAAWHAAGLCQHQCSCNHKRVSHPSSTTFGAACLSLLRALPLVHACACLLNFMWLGASWPVCTDPPFCFGVLRCRTIIVTITLCHSITATKMVLLLACLHATERAEAAQINPQGFQPSTPLCPFFQCPHTSTSFHPFIPLPPNNPAHWPSAAAALTVAPCPPAWTWRASGSGAPGCLRSKPF